MTAFCFPVTRFFILIFIAHSESLTDGSDSESRSIYTVNGFPLESHSVLAKINIFLPGSKLINFTAQSCRNLLKNPPFYHRSRAAPTICRKNENFVSTITSDSSCDSRTTENEPEILSSCSKAVIELSVKFLRSKIIENINCARQNNCLRHISNFSLSADFKFYEQIF